jgi:hypothetical protein
MVAVPVSGARSSRLNKERSDSGTASSPGFQRIVAGEQEAGEFGD